jgi:hypothetical protein
VLADLEKKGSIQISGAMYNLAIRAARFGPEPTAIFTQLDLLEFASRIMAEAGTTA